MNKLFYHLSEHGAIKDSEVECIASYLSHSDIFVSSELVILAARTLVKEKKLKPFILVVNDKEYTIDKNGRFNNGFPDSLFDDFLERLLVEYDI